MLTTLFKLAFILTPQDYPLLSTYFYIESAHLQENVILHLLAQTYVLQYQTVNPGILALDFCHVNTIVGSARPGVKKTKKTFSSTSLSQKLHGKYKCH